MLLLTEQPDTRFVRFHRIGARERLLARLRAWQLDAELANGASPDSSPALSLHAHSLLSATTRRELSRAVRNLLREAERPPHAFDPRVPICRRKVIEAEDALEELADYLLTDGPVEARGVAQMRLLLRDGSSPLFMRPQADDLRQPLRAVFEALELCV